MAIRWRMLSSCSCLTVSDSRHPMNTLHPALLSLFRLTGQLAERASTFSTRAGLDEPIHHLLHVRREKLHRAAVLGLLLLTLLAGSDSEAATREHETSVVQTAHSSRGGAPASAPPSIQPEATGTTVSPGTASADAMLAWLKRQPGFPSGQGVQTRLEILRQPRTAHLAPCQHTEYVLAAGARLWGRVNLGERCTSGATWTVWHNLQLHVEGPALVARQQLAAGSVPQPADFSVQRVDWTRSPTLYPSIPAWEARSCNGHWPPVSRCTPIICGLPPASAQAKWWPPLPRATGLESPPTPSPWPVPARASPSVSAHRAERCSVVWSKGKP